MKKIFQTILLLFCFLFPANSESLIKLDGVSIGDNILEHMSEEEVKFNSQDIYAYIESEKYLVTGFHSKNNNSIINFDATQLTYKKNDEEYIIHGVSLHKTLTGLNVDSDCSSLQDFLVEFYSDKYNLVSAGEPITISHPADPTGESILTQVALSINLEDYIENNITTGSLAIDCMNFSDHVSYPDTLSVSTVSTEFNNWITQVLN